LDDIQENLGRLTKINENNITYNEQKKQLLSKYGLPWRGAYGTKVVINQEWTSESTEKFNPRVYGNYSSNNVLRTFTVPWPPGITCPPERLSDISAMTLPTIETLIEEGIYQNYHDFANPNTNPNPLSDIE
jgi:hypothetical protein